MFSLPRNPTLLERTLGVALVALVSFYAITFIGFLGVVSPFDYDHLSSYYEIAWRFWRTEGGWPQYDPYLCGGRTLGGDPQIPLFSPLTLLVPLLGATALIKLELLAQAAIGACGTWFWLRALGSSRAGQMWGVFLFLSSGAVVARFLVGHVTLGFFFLFPALFFLSGQLCRAAKDRHRTRAIYWALFAYAGFYKPNFLIYAVPLLAIEASARSFFTRSFRPLGELVAATVVGAGVDAIAILPAWKYFSDFPRTSLSEARFIPPYAFFANLVFPLKGVPEKFYGSYFLQRHEYNVFIGPAALLLALVGAKRLWHSPYRKEAASLLVLFIFSAALGVGCTSYTFSWFLPFTWFHELWPGFRSIRVPTRFWFGAFLAILPFCARGIDSIKSRLAIVFLAIFALAPLFVSTAINLAKTTRGHGTQWAIPRTYPSSIQAIQNDTDEQYRHLRAGKGVLNCVDNVEIYRAPDLEEGPLLKPQADTTVGWVGWSRIHVSRQTPSTEPFPLGLNHSDYWQWSGQGKIVSHRGMRLTVAPVAGVLDGTLTYAQPLVREAGLLSLFATLGLFCYALAAFGVIKFPRFLRKQGNSGTLFPWLPSSSA